MRALTIKDAMTFVHADQIARAHGYASRLLMPGETWASTIIERTYALFTSHEEGKTHCIAYSDLTKMDEQTVCTTLEKSSTTAMDVPQH